MDRKKEEKKKFAEEILKDIKDYFPAGYENVECEIQEKEKDNGMIKTGIVFFHSGKKPGSWVCVDDFFEEADTEKRTVTEIKETVSKIALESMENMERTKFELKNFESIEPFLSVKLVNTKANREMLSIMPHRKVEDLSLIFILRFQGTEKNVYGDMPVTYGLAQHWGKSREELYVTAMKNAMRKDAPLLEDTLEVLAEATGQGTGRHNYLYETHPVKETEIISFMLTNESRTYGAAAILYPGVREKIDRIFSEGFYIIPTSVHEVLIASKGCGKSSRELGELVREMNLSGDMERDEYLSDRIYSYDRKKKIICQVMDSVKKEKEAAR